MTCVIYALNIADRYVVSTVLRTDHASSCI